MSFTCNWKSGEYKGKFFDKISDRYELSDGSYYSKEKPNGTYP